MRIQVGSRIDALELQTLAHGTVRVPGTGVSHLQFRRFAGCPICNTHLREFTLRVGELTSAGIMPVVFFHSEVEALETYRADLPFAVVADPGRVHYERFGVERSPFAAMNLGAMRSAMKTIFGGKAMFKGAGAPDGLPADFLIATDGAVLAVNYGRHANDHWEVDEILSRVASRPNVT